MKQKKEREILIIDDQRLFARGLSLLINEIDSFVVKKTFFNSKDAMSFVETNRVGIDLIILDIDMPKMDGIEISKELVKYYPRIKILILLKFNDPKTIFELFKIGVHGFIAKDDDTDVLEIAMRQIFTIGNYFDTDIMEIIHQELKIETDMTSLTKREKEVLKLIAKGRTSKQIAEELFISTYTVGNHRKNIIRKTGATNTAELIKHAYDNNLIDWG